MSDACANTVNRNGNDNEVHVCTVKELLGKQFVIPSYQRGYRWEDMQVRQLFNDLKTAYVEGWPSYNLQPLVVTLKSNGVWCVIDGQQRLTSLYLLLKALKPKKDKLWALSYDTRSGSKEFLEQLEEMDEQSREQKAIENPDFYHMNKAWELFGRAYGEWESERDENKSESSEKKDTYLSFGEYILNHAKFIWYPVKKKDEHIVFQNMNAGKISLMNAELIKLLLNKRATEKYAFSVQWDIIEQRLNNSNFWSFVNPEPNADRFKGCRMEFLIELWARGFFYKYESLRERKRKREGVSEEQRSWLEMFLVELFPERGEEIKAFEENLGFEEELVHNPFLPFTMFELFNRLVPKNTFWENWIYDTFNRFESWYENRTIYHLIGFLMRCKNVEVKRKFKQLYKLLEECKTTDWEEFIRNRKSECKKQLSMVVDDEEEKLEDIVIARWQEWQYPDGRLQNLLLLFNIALTNAQTVEHSRYPFETFESTWTLEHIHAKEEQLQPEEVEVLRKQKTLMDKHHLRVATRMDKEKVWDYIECEGQDLNGLGNMALLDLPRNSSFKNHSFERKREQLQMWLRECRPLSQKLRIGVTDKIAPNSRPSFIPIGTRMVFARLLGVSEDVCPYAWTTEDGKAYVRAIYDIVNTFLS